MALVTKRKREWEKRIERKKIQRARGNKTGTFTSNKPCIPFVAFEIGNVQIQRDRGKQSKG